MNTTLAKPANPRVEIREFLQSDDFKRQVARALPKTMSPERFARVALTATLKNPKLLNTSRESFLQCLMELSAIGLEPDGRHAHLIPRKEVCTYQLDYKGIAALVRRFGDVATIHCDVVGENDEFDYRFGTGGQLSHKPALGNRGQFYCAYSYVRLKDGSEEFDVMSIDDIERIRRRSSSPDEGPWVSDWNEMAKKTVFRRHSKTLPLSPDLRDAIEHDDNQAYTEQERFVAARPATASVAAPKLPRARTPRISEPDNHQPDNSAPESLGGDESAGQKETAEDSPASPAAAPQSPNLVEQVSELLATHKYQTHELLTLLREVKLIGNNVQSLEECSPRALHNVIEDWENCQARMSAKRGAQQ